jgi:hypothetical protein
MTRRALALTLILAGLLVASATAQLPRETKEAYPNFDIRDQAVNAADRTLATARAGRAMGDAKAALAARVPTLQVEMNRAGNAPTNAASVLRISLAARDPGTGGFLVGFPTQNGNLYSVEWNNSLTNPIGWVVLQNNLVGTGNDLQVLDPGAVGQLTRFYRLRGMR